MTERTFALEVVRQLRARGHVAYWAGGCVRDELLGLPPADYDVATDAVPEAVRRAFPRTIAVGESFGVVEVLGPKPLKVQVATFRSDGEYSDGRRPDHVKFGTAIEDAQRRDFTINGMFYDPIDNHIIDFVNGRADLDAKVLRAIGDPYERFREDKLRLLRAVRMAARFNLALEQHTSEAIRAMAGELPVVSAERIADELRKMLVHPRRTIALRMLDAFGLLALTVPETLEMQDLPQGLPSAPTGDLWEHVLRVLDLLPEPTTFPLAFAALYHDVAKRRTAVRTAERYTFHGHEHVGRKMADAAARRLKLSNDDRNRITWLVEKHQYLCDAPIMRPSRLKPVLAHPGIHELLALHRADSRASDRSEAHIDFCERLLRELPPEELDPPPLVTGDDLTALGKPPGPAFKTILQALRDEQLDGTLRDRTAALARMKEMNEPRTQ